MSAIVIVKDIFSVVGIVAITLVILYVLLKLINKYKADNIDTNPDFNHYMTKTGSKCPDGWLYLGDTTDPATNRVMNMCQNMNVPTCNQDKVFDPKTKGPGCYNPGKSLTDHKMQFFNISNWKDYIDGKGDININNDYRCSWLKSCGLPSELIDNASNPCAVPNKASWVGLDQKC